MGVGLWLDIWRLRLISTQVVVKVEVGVELGKNLENWQYWEFKGQRLNRGNNGHRENCDNLDYMENRVISKCE